MNSTYNLKGGKTLQNYPSLARIYHLFTVVCVLRIVTFRFTSKYHFSFYSAPTFRFAGLMLPAYNNTLGGIFIRIRLYFHGKKCLTSQQKTFLFVRVIRCVQAVRCLTLWLKPLYKKHTESRRGRR